MLKNKRGENILTENIMFIVLNLVFIVIIFVFLFSKMGNTAVLEEKYAKQIAMAIDSAKPVMTLEIDMTDAMDKKDESVQNIVTIDKNIVTVNLRDQGKGYSYSFFNSVEISNTPYFNGNKLVLIIDKYK
jgi:preprotein translocase subunit SecD